MNDDSVETKLLLAVLGIVLGALLGWAGNLYLQKRKEAYERKRLLTVLFGEITNVQKHYEIASAELPRRIENGRNILSIVMSKHGELEFSGKDIAQIGFLTDQDVRDLMQMRLVVRNTDYAITAILEEHRRDPFKMDLHSELCELKARMLYARSVAQSAMIDIAKRNPNIQSMLPNSTKSTG